MILVNGKPQTTVNIADRGLQYGDGLFETIAIAAGKPLLLQRHLSRLLCGCKRLGITAAGLETAILQDIALLNLAADEHGILKIIITRGPGGRGYSPAGCNDPTRILAVYPWPNYPATLNEGIKLRFCKIPLSRNTALAGIKHLNRLEQVLARSEWQDPAIFEGLMFDEEGHLIEGTMSNVFLVCGDQLLTPDLTRSGVAGVMRQLILEICKKNQIEVTEKTLTRADLLNADEVFISNSVIRVLPVTAITDFTEYKAGAIAPKLRVWIDQAELQELLP